MGLELSRWECSAALRFGFKGWTLASDCRRREVSKIRQVQTEALLEPTCRRVRRFLSIPAKRSNRKRTSPPFII